MSLKIGAIPDKNRLKVRQSPTAHMPSIPMRACFFANSGGGKTNLIASLRTNPKLFGVMCLMRCMWFPLALMLTVRGNITKGIGPGGARKMSYLWKSGMVNEYSR